MWNLIALVPDHCLSFYFDRNLCRRLKTNEDSENLLMFGFIEKTELLKMKTCLCTLLVV